MKKGLHFLQSHSIYYCNFAKVFTHFAQNFQRFCSDFKWFCPDFHQIKNFWGALSPPAPQPPSPASINVRGASKLMSWFSPPFSGALVHAIVLTLLIKSFAVKKRLSLGVLVNTSRFLRFFSSETLPFLAPGG